MNQSTDSFHADLLVHIRAMPNEALDAWAERTGKLNEFSRQLRAEIFSEQFDRQKKLFPRLTISQFARDVYAKFRVANAKTLVVDYRVYKKFSGDLSIYFHGMYWQVAEKVPKRLRKSSLAFAVAEREAGRFDLKVFRKHVTRESNKFRMNRKRYIDPVESIEITISVMRETNRRQPGRIYRHRGYSGTIVICRNHLKHIPLQRN